MTSTKSTQSFEQIFQSFRLLPLLHHHSTKQSITKLPTLPLTPRPPTSSSTESPFKDLTQTKLNHQWNLSNHLFPAAYPRTINGSALSNKPNQQLTNLSKDGDRTEMANRVYEANRDSIRLDENTQLDQIDEKQLYISVNRYFKTLSTSFKSNKNGLTLILSHANGLHKETWEPMLSYLLQSSQSDLIDEIWSLDCVNQGDSAILNQDSLGERFYWGDTSRDLLQFIISYLPEFTNAQGKKSLPRMLTEQALKDKSILTLDSRPSTTNPSNWRGRRICLIGHSLGGNATALALTSTPELINSAILIDPVIIPPLQTDMDTERIAKFRTSLSVHRRSTWKTRDEAKQSFLKNQNFFGRWDPNVLNRYLQFGLYEKSHQEIGLKTEPSQESLVFADPFDHPRLAYQRLKHLMNSSGMQRPKVRFIYADENQSAIPEPILKVYIDELKKQNAKVVRIKDAGHLIVQELPEKLADCVGWFLEEIYHGEKRIAKL